MKTEKEDIKDGEIVNEDGTVFRFEGKEPLKKPKGKIKKSIQERWELLKADLSNSESFFNMLEGEKDEEGEAGDKSGDADDDDGSSVPASDNQGGEGADQSNVADDSRMPGANLGVGAKLDAAIDDKQPQPDTASQQPEAGGQEDQQQPEAGGQEDQQQPYSEDELKELLSGEGYSDSEIAYIVHHQVPAQPTKEELKHAETVQDLKHKGAKQGQELDHKDAHHDIDVDHKKRMTDLEFDHAKKEKEMRLKFLEQELQAKIEALKNKQKE